MDNKDDENNKLFDEIDDEEEIKEDIVIENDDENDNEVKNKNDQILNTYDKFLIDSVAINGFENKNEYHYILKNQMANIIDDIKKKQNEEQMNKNNIKKMIFQNMENIFFNKKDENKNIEEENKVSNDNNKNDIKINNAKNININQYTLNPQQMINQNNNTEDINNSNNYLENLRDLDESNDNDKTEKIYSKDNINISNNNENTTKNEEKNKSINLNIKKDRGYLNNQNEEPDSKEYNINIEDFLKDNTANDEDIVNNATNLNVENSENNINNIYQNQFDEYKNEKKVDNKNIKYTVMGNPEMEKKINENYDYFSQKNKNSMNMNQQLTAKFNALASREKHYKNNDNDSNEIYKNYDKKSEMIYIDDCQNEEERKAKQKKFEELKQKKLKELEQKISHKRAKSKPKPIINNNQENNDSNKNDNISSNRKPIILRPKTSKTKPMTYVNNHTKNSHVAISAINKDDSNINSNYYNDKKSQNITKSKKMARPFSTKSNNFPKINNNHNNTTLMSNNTSHFSTISRVPIKIEREESKIANKKVKNVHYSKMSNKKIIKKAINEVCLAGNNNKEYRDKINEIIDKCEFENYIILFRGNYGRFDIKAIYTYDIQNKNIEILTCMGNAPNFIDASMVATFYKYNVSANQFKELRGTKEFSCIVDGVCLRK
jgi:hypothetical protein